MKKSVVTLFLAAAFLTACKKTTEAGEAQDVKDASAEAVTYTVDTAQSTIEWSGSKPMGKHNGTLNLASGSFSVKDGVIEGGSFVLDMNSITVLDLKAGDGKEDLEGHLKGMAAKTEEDADHFFNVSKYPQGKFEITSVKPGQDGKTTVEGNLTLKETTKSVSFPATVTVTDSEVSLTSDEFRIDRTQWKVNYGSKSIFKDLGDKYVDDEIGLKVTVKAKK